jgi:hypothetical protein
MFSPPGSRPGPARISFTFHEAWPQTPASPATTSGRQRRWARALIPALAGVLLLAASPTLAASCAKALATAAEIQTAMRNATAGTTILVAPGEYVGLRSTSGHSKSHFYSSRSGTASRPIVLKSCDPLRPAVFLGDGPDDGSYVFRLTGDHWLVEDVVVANGTKGIILDNANHNVLRRIEVHSTGDEGIHIRDGSSWNIVEQSRLHDIGLVRPGYGEGIYVGSDSSAAYEHRVVGNVIRTTAFTGGVGGEHIDIKEGADGTLVEYCAFDGRGISGEHYADSFIDVKGVNSIIHHNVGYRHGNAKIVDAFQVRVMPGVYASGHNNQFHSNTMDIDACAGYLLRAMSGTSQTTAYANVRVGGGKLYSSDVNQLQALESDGPMPGARLALAGFHPNPARGLESLAFSLASADDARLEILDVQGRRVFGAEVGAMGPGPHAIRADRLPRLAPGVYLVTLVQAGERRTTRGVILH